MPNIERDHFPEAVDNGKGVRRLELLGAKELLRDRSQRRQLFASLSNDELTRFTGWTNSITQEQAISYEYEDGQLPNSATPPLEDKAMLMNQAYETVRQLASDTSLDDRTALRRAGLALAGAMAYIHPKLNGNGRTGRLMHYLIEFGTERGDAAVNDEMYAVIGKLPVYDSDSRVAIDDTVPEELEFALASHMRQNSSQYDTLSPRARATARVLGFLDMMRGSAVVPINKEVVRSYGSMDRGARKIEVYEPNQIDGLQLYERDYVNYSELPNRLPSDVPYGAHRVMAEKSEASASSDIRVPFDVV